MTDTTADETLGTTNIKPGDSTKSETAKKAWDGIKTAALYVLSFGIKTIGIVVLIVAILGALLFYTPQGKRLVNWSEAKFSSSINPNVINLGTVNAHFTKTFWILGAKEIVFTSTMAKGSLTEDGKMEFKIFQKDGLNGYVTGIVAIKPALKSNETGSYDFMGNGMSGSFDVTVTGSNVTVNNFDMNINTTLVNK